MIHLKLKQTTCVFIRETTIVQLTTNSIITFKYTIEDLLNVKFIYDLQILSI